MAKLASVRARIDPKGPIGPPESSTIKWRAKGPNGGTAEWWSGTGPRLIDEVEVLPEGVLLAHGAIPGLTYEWELANPRWPRPANWPASFVPRPGERVELGEARFGAGPGPVNSPNSP